MTGRHAEPEVDRGAQLERTSLAWNRTAVSVAAVGALLLRQGVRDEVLALLALGGVVLALALAVWLLTTSRYAAAAGRRTRHLLAGNRFATAGLAGLVAAISLAAVSAALLNLGG